MKFKILLGLSLATNIWFQFKDAAFSEYVEYNYCEPGSITVGFQSTTFEVWGMHPLHINMIVINDEGKPQVSCNREEKSDE